MKYIDLEKKDLQELNKLLKEKKIDLFTLKVKHKTMQLQNTSELRLIKKDISRIKTAISSISKRS